MDYSAWAQGDWDRTPDLWESQGGGLRIASLLRALQTALAYRPEWASLPVVVENYVGDGDRLRLAIAEIGFTGQGENPDAVVLTVVKDS